MRARRGSSQREPHAFLCLFGRVTRRARVMSMLASTPGGAHDSNDEIVEPYHDGKYAQSNRDQR